MDLQINLNSLALMESLTNRMMDQSTLPNTLDIEFENSSY
jgi:hypothetical protein